MNILRNRYKVNEENVHDLCDKLNSFYKFNAHIKK